VDAGADYELGDERLRAGEQVTDLVSFPIDGVGRSG
jgi:hypothetical protein